MWVQPSALLLSSRGQVCERKTSRSPAQWAAFSEATRLGVGALEGRVEWLMDGDLGNSSLGASSVPELLGQP